MEDYYIEKLEADEKFNTFLRYCKMPKYPVLFILITATVMAKISNLTNIWLPSLLAIFIMWNCWIGFMEKDRIVEKCVVEETIMKMELDGLIANNIKDFPFGPLYVTDEDRDTILLMHVLNYWNMTMKEKIRWHHIELISMTTVYVGIYLVVWCLN